MGGSGDELRLDGNFFRRRVCDKVQMRRTRRRRRPRRRRRRRRPRQRWWRPRRQRRRRRSRLAILAAHNLATPGERATAAASLAFRGARSPTTHVEARRQTRRARARKTFRCNVGRRFFCSLAAAWDAAAAAAAAQQRCVFSDGGCVLVTNQAVARSLERCARRRRGGSRRQNVASERRRARASKKKKTATADGARALSIAKTTHVAYGYKARRRRVAITPAV